VLEFSDWLRAELERRNVSLKDFADEVGVSKSAVSMWASGKRKPDADTAVRIAAGLDKPAEVVLGYLGYGMSLPERETDLRRELSGLRRKRQEIRHQMADLEYQLGEIESDIVDGEWRMISLALTSANMRLDASTSRAFADLSTPPFTDSRLVQMINTVLNVDTTGHMVASMPDKQSEVRQMTNRIIGEVHALTPERWMHPEGERELELLRQGIILGSAVRAVNARPPDDSVK
jgi:transcriptional regulator with XRE-family HTH domain